MNKLYMYIKPWKTDYDFIFYILKILGYILTVCYFAITLGDRKKTKHFNAEKNIFFKIRNKRMADRYQEDNDTFNHKFLRGDIYDFNGIYLPKIENTQLMRSVYDDSLKIYTEFDDNYSHTIVDQLEKELPEGTYCYLGSQGEEILVKQGHTVLDAGAWIGDFSAYAAKKGASVYAFEPSPINIKFLNKTILLNKDAPGDITIVPFGLGSKDETLEFLENNEDGNTGGNTFLIPKGDGTAILDITTIDNWVKKNDIKKIDFIKSDIEGYERHMLSGATKTLREHQPILSICTYHLPDDREVIRDIILTANPNYTIIQRKMKLFAYVK